MFYENFFTGAACLLKLGRITQLLKEIMRVIFCTSSMYDVRVLLTRYMGNFLSVRPGKQRQKQSERRFCSRCCIFWSEVGVLARKIVLAMTVVMEL